jgi:hypothetical protein
MPTLGVREVEIRRFILFCATHNITLILVIPSPYHLPQAWSMGIHRYEAIPGCFVDAQGGGTGERGRMRDFFGGVREVRGVLWGVGEGGLEGAVVGDEECSPRG